MKQSLKFFGGLWMVLCLGATALYAQPGLALERLLANAGLRNAVMGIAIRDCADGKEVFNYQGQLALHPASVAKLLPSAWALEKRGADFCFKTRVFYSGGIREHAIEGDVVIVPSGDPTPDSRYFPDSCFIRKFVSVLREKGIHTIKGRIIVQGESEEEIPGSWPWEDISNYYGALCHRFNYRDNTYCLNFTTGAAGTTARLLSVEPALSEIRFRNQVKAAASGGDNAWIYGGPYSNVLYVKGTLPAHQASFQVKGAMHQPEKYFIAELTTYLKKEGIKIEQRIPRNTTLEELWVYTSPLLEEIVFHTNKSSVNLFAEALGQLMAPFQYERALKRWLSGQGIDTSGILLKDACGLSPQNAIPAETIAHLLYTQRNNTAWVRSLPVAGTDRGLNVYLRHHPVLKNKLSAKTGSFSGVRCLAGYLTTSSGKRLAFAFFINNYTCPAAVVYEAVGAFLSDWVSY